MIAVIADDFTGAAEIGGIGLNHGLRVLIETKVKAVSGIDLLIIATDTRSLSPMQAVPVIRKITELLNKIQPSLIYKKVDSVLRGNVGQELHTQMEVSGIKKALIVAGNPHFGRTIQNGIFMISSVPLAETDFANDPDFPVRSSSVLEILQNSGCQVFSKSVEEDLPEEGIVVADVKDQNDMLKWISRTDDTTALAGGAEFFDMLLSSKFSGKPFSENSIFFPGEKTLFIFGSRYPKRPEFVDSLCSAGILFQNMPEEIYLRRDFARIHFDDWVSGVVKNLRENRKVAVMAGYSGRSERILAKRIRETMALLVQQVMKEVDLTDLFIEGGATTSEILRVLRIKKMYPCRVIDRGIIQMKVRKYPALWITTKPGSYSWPSSLPLEKRNDLIEIV